MAERQFQKRTIMGSEDLPVRQRPDGTLYVFDPAISPAEGTTTADGNPGGTTLIDTDRTEPNDHWNGMALLITSGAQNGQVREIADWVVGTGTFTVAPAFGGQILEDVTYKILTNLPVSVDIAAVEAKLDADLLIDRGRVKCVEVEDIANWHIELIHNRGGLIPAADIAPGTCTIEQWRVAAKIADIDPTSHVAADGEIHTVYTFTAADGWQPGDQAHIIISGASVVIGGITTSLPDIEFHVRMSREKTISDAIGVVDGIIDDIKTETDKLVGVDVDTESVALNIGAGEVTLFTITTATRIEVLGAFCSMAGTTPVTGAATITVRVYLTINGAEVKIAENKYVKDTDPDGIIILDSTIGITGNLRVTLQSDNAGDNATTVPYQYVTRTME